MGGRARQLSGFCVNTPWPSAPAVGGGCDPDRRDSEFSVGVRCRPRLLLSVPWPGAWRPSPAGIGIWSPRASGPTHRLSTFGVPGSAIVARHRGSPETSCGGFGQLRPSTAPSADLPCCRYWPMPACGSMRPCPEMSSTWPMTGAIASRAWSARAAMAIARYSRRRWPGPSTTTSKGAHRPVRSGRPSKKPGVGLVARVGRKSPAGERTQEHMGPARL